MIEYKDILEEMAKIRDIIFMTKTWSPTVAYTHGSKLTVNEIRPLIFKSSRIQQVIEKMSREKQLPKEELYAQVRGYLEEMGHNRNMTIIRWVGLALCKIMRKNYNGIIVNETSILKAKSVMGPNPVIFAPSHRSYADFILMSFLCFYYDIEIPAIAAGMDFKGMWIVGDILRDCCAFFIKRTFGGDDLYKATFHEYITSLVSCGESALEFFIEGTRSRTGKSLVPKFGLLTAALEQYFLGKVPDVTIIPVSITYECVLEEKLFASELLGIPKPKESTRGLFKALKILSNNYGRIFVEFGVPISVQAFSQGFLPEDPRLNISQNVLPSSSSYVTPEIDSVLKHLGYEIVHAQNEGMKCTPIHLVAATMSIFLIYCSEASLYDVLDQMAILRSVLNDCEDLSLPEIGMKELQYCVNIHQQFLLYDKMKETVQLREPTEFVYSVEDSSLRGYKLLDATLKQVYPIMMLQQYANPICVKLCHVSLVTILIYIADEDDIDAADLYGQYTYLRDILSLEFVLLSSEPSKEHDFLETLCKVLELGLIDYSQAYSNHLTLKKSEKDTEFFTRDVMLMCILFPFIQGYWMTIKECCKTASENESLVIASKFYKQIQRSMEANMEANAIHGYALSLDLISNSLNSFVAMQALQKSKSAQGELQYLINLEKCVPIMQKLESVVTMIWRNILDHYNERSKNPKMKKKCNL